jgi:hypothetical protein
LSKSENIEVLQNILQKKTGIEISVRIEGQDSSFNSTSDPSLNEDPDILKAKDIAKKANIPLNIIDE